MTITTLETFNRNVLYSEVEIYIAIGKSWVYTTARFYAVKKSIIWNKYIIMTTFSSVSFRSYLILSTEIYLLYICA